jgi:hypothetical protein
MKKVLLLTTIFCGTLAFTSCTKRNNYDCTCTVFTTTSVTGTRLIINASEDEAKDHCATLGTSCSITKS